MASPFVIREHTFEGQHIREYRDTLRTNQEEVVLLHAKSYTPIEVDNGSTQGDLTIIALHANAFHKELYEPFFRALYQSLKSQGLTLGSIWIADQAGQGTSGLLNSEAVGSENNWFDHSRDVLQMVNQFRRQMKRPIIAVGHSMGGTQAVAMAHYHPRLFEAIVLIDATMSYRYSPTILPMLKFVLDKPEVFKSKAEADAFVRKHPFFKRWDPEVTDRYIDTGFVGDQEPTDSAKPVRLKTTTEAEFNTLARPNPDHVSVQVALTDDQRLDHPDLDVRAALTGPTYNPFTRTAYTWLPTLRPAALYVLGKGSKIVFKDVLKERTELTGTGPGGSGGIAAGNVASVIVPGGHFLPMTNPAGTAEETAGWVKTRVDIWRRNEEALVRAQKDVGITSKQRESEKLREVIKEWDGKPWHNPHARTGGPSSKL